MKLKGLLEKGERDKEYSVQYLAFEFPENTVCALFETMATFPE